MLEKKVVLGVDSRLGLLSGINGLANAVKATLGPKGRFVALQRDAGVHVTKDGVTVAKEIFFKDKLADVGARLLKQAAQKTGSIAGDGTTSATVLAQSLINNGHKFITAGAAPIDLKRGMDKALEVAVQHFRANAKLIDGDWDKIRAISKISANNDEQVGNLITDAYMQVGMGGVISVDDSKTSEDHIELVSGMQWDNGYVSPYFITNPKNMSTEYENCFVLVYDGKFHNMKHVVEILDKVAATGRPILFIAEDFDVQTISLLVLNKVRGGLPIVAVKAPAYGTRRKNIMEDICVLTGATLISEFEGLSLDRVGLEHLGEVGSLKVTQNSFTMIDGCGDPQEIERRVEFLKAQLEQADNSWKEEKVKERIAKLQGGIAVIRVGAFTEVEAKEKKDRIDDALHACKAAVMEGYLPGGGTAYIRAIKDLEKIKVNNHDQQLGIDLVIEALKSITYWVSTNAGESGDVVVDRVLRSSKYNYGYNAKEDCYVDMLEAGIIDPTMVCRTALENAVSVAGIILTTQATVINEQQALDEEEMSIDPSMI